MGRENGISRAGGTFKILQRIISIMSIEQNEQDNQPSEKLIRGHDFSGIVKLRDGTIAICIRDDATGNWLAYPIWDRVYYLDSAGFCGNRKKDIIQCYKTSLKQPQIPQKVV